MGYTTSFEGRFVFDQPLPAEVITSIRRLEGVDTRALEGVYPGNYCQWVLTEDSRGLEWDDEEKFYDYVEWLQWIIDSILKPAGIKLHGLVSYSGESVRDHGTLYVDPVSQTVIQEPTTDVPPAQLQAFRDFVLESEWGDEILEAWNNRAHSQ